MIASRAIVRRVRAASWRERRAALQALAYIAAADLALRVRGFGWLALRLRPAAGEDDAAARDRAETMARAIERAGRLYPAHAECLHRAAALQLWLRRSGICSEFRIGVLKEAGALRAHAWVEVGGRPLLDAAADVARFAPIFSAQQAAPSDVFADEELRWAQ